MSVLKSYITSSMYQEIFLELIDQDAISIYESSLKIRIAEEVVAKWKECGHIIGPVHLSAGQELIAVALSLALRGGDKVFGGHRSHHLYLALTNDYLGFFRELLNLSSGCSQGFGGSMHLYGSKDSIFAFSNPIIANTVSPALGYAYANRVDKSNMRIGCCVVGDGAFEEGVLHEAMNLAVITKSPFLLVCENNLMASHLAIEARRFNPSISKIAVAAGMNVFRVNGNDAGMLNIQIAEAVEQVRKGHPTLVELFTYRHYGHVDYRKDLDVGVHRNQDDYESWLSKDPLELLYNFILSSGKMKREEINLLKINAKKTVIDISEIVMRELL